MITRKEILQLHELSIQTYGGAHGLSILLSCLFLIFPSSIFLHYTLGF